VCVLGGGGQAIEEVGGTSVRWWCSEGPTSISGGRRGWRGGDVEARGGEKEGKAQAGGGRHMEVVARGRQSLQGRAVPLLREGRPFVKLSCRSRQEVKGWYKTTNPTSKSTVSTTLNQISSLT
jgi:hypothetical protein